MNDFGLICICAVRYAIGRRTYVTDAVPSFIIKHIKDIDKSDLRIMKRDVEEEILRGNYGDPNIDLPNWERFLDKLRKELDE